MDKLIGRIVQKSGISGKIIQKPESGLCGTIGIPYGSNKYQGEYIVTPKAYEETILNTANKTMLDDVTVKIIPYHETSNLSGGYTVVIAQEE